MCVEEKKEWWKRSVNTPLHGWRVCVCLLSDTSVSSLDCQSLHTCNRACSMPSDKVYCIKTPLLQKRLLFKPTYQMFFHESLLQKEIWISSLSWHTSQLECPNHCFHIPFTFLLDLHSQISQIFFQNYQNNRMQYVTQGKVELLRLKENCYGFRHHSDCYCYCEFETNKKRCHAKFSLTSGIWKF